MSSLKLFTEEEYLELEIKADYKNEFYKGEIRPYASLARNHHMVVVAIVGAVYPSLKNHRAIIFLGNQRLYVVGLYTYPDITIVCVEEKYLDDKYDTLTNPTVLFEVLSPATEEYDRGTKFKLYRSIPSLQNYVMISSTEYAAEVYTRHNDEWILSTTKGRHGKLYISAIDYTMNLAEIYAQITEFASN